MVDDIVVVDFVVDDFVVVDFVVDDSVVVAIVVVLCVVVVGYLYSNTIHGENPLRSCRS